jgi:hypothetical protein
MHPIAFCDRCRGMSIGWNQRYLVHCLFCKDWLSQSAKLLFLMAFTSMLVLLFSTPTALVFSDQTADQNSELTAQEQIVQAITEKEDPAVKTIDGFLNRHRVDQGQRGRIATAIVNSGRKYNVDPLLIASIMIVESRANPFAISGSDAIGIMQIHLPTWGQKAEHEGINLFKIEDNVDFGVRILKDYVHEFGLWDGVKRYKGWNADKPESTQAVSDYVTKVQSIYANHKS